MLGSENRAFEINHENYAIEALGAYRIRSIEIAGVFHHTSRHLSDRANSSVVAWNVGAIRASRRFALGASTLDARLEAGRVLQSTYVDYRWKTSLRLALRRPLRDRIGFFAAGAGDLVGVDPETAGRLERLCGGSLEAGVRLGGRTAALELFAGYERRIDAYPVDRVRVRWTALGFRFAS